MFINLKFFEDFCLGWYVRHTECEIDKNCPFVILLDCDDKCGKTNHKENLDIDVLHSIDHHFCSFSHFDEFESTNWVSELAISTIL